MLLVGKADRAALKYQKPVITRFSSVSDAGKSTIADSVERRLNLTGYHNTMLDGDKVCHGLNRDLGFAEVERVENIRRVDEIANQIVESGLIVLCSLISPYRVERDMVRRFVADSELLEVFVDTEDCMKCDPGVYTRRSKPERSKIAQALMHRTGPRTIPISI